MCYEKDLVSLTCNCTAKESCIQVVKFCIHRQASCFVFRIMLNMALLLRVVNEGEHVVVNQVVEEVDPSVVVGVRWNDSGPGLFRQRRQAPDAYNPTLYFTNLFHVCLFLLH